MKMNIIKRFGLVTIICFLMVVPAFSQTKNVKTITVEVHQVIKNGGTVIVSVCCSEEAYKKRQPDLTIQCEPFGSIIRADVTVPTGDCVINVYQDRNGNGKCDNNLLGIPKEPVGITNWDGKGPPGSFNKLKINITHTTQTIRIHLYQL